MAVGKVECFQGCFFFDYGERIEQVGKWMVGNLGGFVGDVLRGVGMKLEEREGAKVGFRCWVSLVCG